MRLRHALGLLPAFLLVSISTAQTTFTWSGLGTVTEGITEFNDPANWVGGVVPGNGDHLVFGSGPSINVNLATSRTVGDITFSGITNGNYFVTTNSASLTLNGNVSTTAGSLYWGLFELPVILAAGNHTYTTGGNASLYHFGVVQGSGGIIKNGPNSLYLTSENNTYTGGTVLNAGTIGVGADYALGFGTVTLNGGTLRVAYAENDIRLGNDFVLGSTVNIDTSEFIPENGTHGLILGNGDGSDITPASGVSTVNLRLTGPQWLELSGDMQDGQSATSYNFFNNDGRNTYYLSGFNNYSGGTIVQNDAKVVFRYESAIPDSGSIAIAPEGYASITEATAQSKFLARLATGGVAGTIGFENDVVYTGPIDLSNFTANGGSVSIGTTTAAGINGLITPATAAGQYRFRSSGTLYLAGTNPLSGARDVVSTSLPGDTPGLLVLRQSVANTYTGDTIADGGAVVFDSAGSLSANTAIHLTNNGYVSVTNSSAISLATLIERVADGSVTGSGIIGFDTTNGIQGGFQNFTYSDPVDMSALSDDVYLGTASQETTLSGLITTTQGDSGDYFLTGYRYGYLKISSQLTGSRALHAGVFEGRNATVYLTNTNNTYDGGTSINAGSLIAQGPGSLGSGTITVDPVSADTIPYLTIVGGGTLANDLQLNSGMLRTYVNAGTFSGEVSGAGGLIIESDLTLSGMNSYSGGTFIPDGTLVTAITNTALGSGGLSLDTGSTVQFTSSAPQIGSLLLGGTYFYDDDGFFERSSILKFATGGNATLTINQTEDGYFEGAIGQGSGIGSLVKHGNGTLTIGGLVGEDNDVHNPYTGGTTINAGRLIAGSANALGTGTITINGGELGTDASVTLTNAIAFGANGGRLGGNGTFTVPITAGTNVTLAPGASPGTMTFTSGLTLAGGGSLEFEIQFANGVAGTGYDLIHISAGLLDITANAGSPFTIQLTSLDGLGVAGDVADFSSATGYTWMIFQGNSVSGINGFDASKFTIDASSFTNGLDGGVFSLTLGLNAGNPALFLNFSPVPEPSTYALMVSGLFAVLFLRRRRA